MENHSRDRVINKDRMRIVKMEKIHAGRKSKLSKHFGSICMTQNQNGLETLTEKGISPEGKLFPPERIHPFLFITCLIK